MNITDKSGVVHIPNRAGKHTACRTYIKPHWRETDAPVTCEKCRASSVYAQSLLALLDSRLLNNHLCEIWQIEVTAGVVIEKPRADVLAWCERRLAARATFVNKCIRGGGGAPVLGKLRVS